MSWIDYSVNITSGGNLPVCVINYFLYLVGVKLGPESALNSFLLNINIICYISYMSYVGYLLY